MKSLFFYIAMQFFLISCADNPGRKQIANASIPLQDSLEELRMKISTDSLNPDLWRSLYQLYIDRNDTLDAMNSLRKYNFLSPEDGDGWLAMAGLLAARKNPGVLIVTDSLLLVKDEMIRTRARYIRGIYYSNIDQDDQALREFDSTIIHHYTFIDAYIEKGIILHNRKQFAEALKTFQQAFKIANNNPELYLWIGKCYDGLGNKAEAADWQKKYDALK